MVLVCSRSRSDIKRNGNLVNDAIETFKQLGELIKYYETEVEETKKDLDTVEGAINEAELQAHIRAYTDQIFELRYIQKILRGKHRSEEK